MLASSSLETCVRESDANITCSKKLVLTLTVGSGQALQTEELSLDITCLGRWGPILAHCGAGACEGGSL